MSNTTTERIYGPYPDRGRWRVIVTGPSGRTAESFTYEAQAREYRATLETRQATRTVGAAVEAYLEHAAKRGNTPESVATTGYRLRGLLAPRTDSPIGALTPDVAAELYARYTAGRATDTHRNTLGQARTAGKWWVRQGWLPVNPWLDVEGTGRRRKGKRQLRMDDTRKLVDAALGRAERDWGALAVVTQLLLGLRSGELLRIHARDFDCGGTVLLVPVSKTESGVRELELPAVLQPLLAARAAVAPRLFPRSVWWVRNEVRVLCEQVNVPRVTAHALRGMHATIAIKRGATAHVVAAALGHSSPRITAGSYIAPGTVRDLLGGGA
jgi:integrase